MRALDRFRRCVAMVGLSALCGGALAQGAVLVAPLPELPTPRVITVAIEVMDANGWSVVWRDAASFTAQRGRSRIRILVADGALRAVDQADHGRPVRQRNADPFEGNSLEPVPEPALAGLKAELRESLALAARDPSAAHPGTAAAIGATQNRVLLELPQQADEAQVLRAARAALEGRGWTLLPDEDGAVVAHMKRMEAESRLKVFVADGALWFTDNTVRSGSVERTHIPDRWVRNLRFDISSRLRSLGGTAPRPAARRAEPAPAPQPAAAPRGNVAERLRQLQNLLDASVITPDEYTKKRAEILKEL